MQISPSTGKALDLSGALLFVALFLAFLFFGLHVFALGCGISAIAFVASWRVWNAPDDVERRFNLTMARIFAAFAAVIFILAFASLVLA